MAFDVVGGGMKQVEDRNHKEGLGGQSAMELAAAMVRNRALADIRVWVVVVSKPGQERRARRELELQGFETYLPMKLSMNRKAQELVAMPFFPRYLFARVSLDIGDWKKIWYTYGVHGLLGTADRPVGVKDALIERVRAAEEDGYIKMGLEAEGKHFRAGERVVAEHGDLAFEGVFQERVDDKRAMILVSCLGRDSRFVVDLRKLRATGV